MSSALYFLLLLGLRQARRCDMSLQRKYLFREHDERAALADHPAEELRIRGNHLAKYGMGPRSEVDRRHNLVVRHVRPGAPVEQEVCDVYVALLSGVSPLRSVALRLASKLATSMRATSTWP